MNNLLENSALPSLWTAAQAEAFSSACAAAYENLWLPLQVPAWIVWWQALQTSFHDGAVALQSFWQFAFLTCRPMVLASWFIGRWLVRWIWNHILVQGISQRGVQYLTYIGKRWWAWQKSLTVEQVLVEVACVVGAAAVVQGIRVLRRHAYVQRCLRWVSVRVDRLKRSYRKTRQSVSRRYTKAVSQIAQTSLQAAMMTPHVLWWGGSVAVKVLFGELVTWLACETALCTLFKVLYPLFASLLVIQEERLWKAENAKDAKEASEKSSEAFKTPKRRRSRRKSRRLSLISSPVVTRFFSKTHPHNDERDSKENDDTMEWKESDWKDRKTYWLQFWAVSAAWQVLRRLICILPGPSHLLARYPLVQTTFTEMDLGFYLWIYFVPCPTIPNAPEGRPLPLLAPVVARIADQFYRSLNVVSPEWWQRYIVSWMQLPFSFAVMTRLISQENADRYRRALTHGQSFLIPTATLLLPRFCSIYGQLFVQYALPLYQSSSSDGTVTDGSSNATMLQYWMVHTVVTAAVNKMEGLLWWIPLSRVAVYILFLVLATSNSLASNMILVLLRDLEIFGVFKPADASTTNTSVDQSWTAQATMAVLERLPKAAPSTPVSEKAQGEESKLPLEMVENNKDETMNPGPTKTSQQATKPKSKQHDKDEVVSMDIDSDVSVEVKRESNDTENVVNSSSSDESPYEDEVPRKKRQNHRTTQNLRRSQRNRKQTLAKATS